MRTKLATLALLAVCACGPAQQATDAGPAPAPAVAPAAASEIEITSPQAGATVTSPIRVTGVAPGNWYFEAVFDAQLVGADGEVLAQAPAQAQSNWMTTGPVPFVAELTFGTSVETAATIVLTEDNSGDKPNPRQVRIPVTLRP